LNLEHSFIFICDVFELFHSHRSFSNLQFIPDQGWTSGYSQNGSSGVTSSYGGGGQMHGGSKYSYFFFPAFIFPAFMLIPTSTTSFLFLRFFIWHILCCLGTTRSICFMSTNNFLLEGGGSWNNNRQAWAGHWGGDKSSLTNSSVFGSHNGIYASNGGGSGWGGGSGGHSKKSFIFKLSA
jgi:hypothetical protein